MQSCGIIAHINWHYSCGIRCMKTLTELEKDVLDEYVLDIKNNITISRVHEDNSKLLYDLDKGKLASFNLLKDNIPYVMLNGNFNDEQTACLCSIIEEGLKAQDQSQQISFYIGEYIPSLCFYVESTPQPRIEDA